MAGGQLVCQTSKEMKEIDQEIDIQAQMAYMSGETRREIRDQMRSDRLSEREDLLNFGPNVNALDITRRETVWALTEVGPFKKYLHR